MTQTFASLRGALEAALAGPDSPDALRDQARRHLAALDAPVRITVIGRRRMGKTGIMNFLAGREVLPLEADLGVVRLVHGKLGHATVRMGDGTTEHARSAEELAAIARRGPALTVLEAPLRALRRIALTEMRLPEDRTAAMRAMAWAARETDLVLWCTEHFDSGERAAWDALPDALRDETLLLLTRTDRYPDAGIARSLDALERDVGDEVERIIPVSARDATFARGDGGLDRSLFERSGAGILVTSVLDYIRARSRSIGDRAEILLARHGFQIVPPAERAADADPHLASTNAGGRNPTTLPTLAAPVAAADSIRDGEVLHPPPLRLENRITEDEILGEDALPDLSVPQSNHSMEDAILAEIFGTDIIAFLNVDRGGTRDER